MGVVGGIAVVLSVVIILAYRNYRYEQELDSLLWKIDSAEIKVSLIQFFIMLVLLYATEAEVRLLSVHNSTSKPPRLDQD